MKCFLYCFLNEFQFNFFMELFISFHILFPLYTSRFFPIDLLMRGLWKVIFSTCLVLCT